MKNTLRMMLISLFAAVSCSGFADTATTMPTTSAFSPAQIDQLHTIIHDYVVNNPQMLVEASKTLQAQQQKQMESFEQSAVQQNKAELFDNASSPSVGSKSASMILVEFFDYQCGHCREMAPIVDKIIHSDKNVRVIFKELPIFGGVSTFAAKAALAAEIDQPGKYHEFHTLLFNSTSQLSKDSILAMAKKAGLDVAKLKQTMNSPAVEKQLKDNFMLAENLKIMGTPSFVISNKAETQFDFIPGATSEEELKAKLK